MSRTTRLLHLAGTLRFRFRSRPVRCYPMPWAMVVRASARSRTRMQSIFSSRLCTLGICRGYPHTLVHIRARAAQHSYPWGCAAHAAQHPSARRCLVLQVRRHQPDPTVRRYPHQRARGCRPSVRTCATLHRSMRSHAPAHCSRARVSMPLHMGAGRGAKDRRGVEGLFALSHRARGIGTESRCVAICFPGFAFTPIRVPRSTIQVVHLDRH